MVVEDATERTFLILSTKYFEKWSQSEFIYKVP